MLDLIIVGAGPCGLATAIEAQKNNLSYVVIDKGSVVDSIRRYPNNMTFFSTPELLELDNLPFPTAGLRSNRIEALSYYLKVVKYHGLNIQQYAEVKEVEKTAEGFEIITQKEEKLKATQVVLAIGYYQKPKYLNVPGENLPKVQHYYDEPYPHAFRKVAVVGAGNSGVEAALDLFRNDAEVTFIHRGGEPAKNLKYWIKPDIENRIKKGEIKAFWHTEVLEIRPDELLLKNLKTGEIFTHENDHIYLLTGYKPDATFLQKCGVKVNEQDLVPEYNEETLESNVAGLYLAGTVICGIYTGKIFIENGRHHGKRIVQAILARKAQKSHTLLA